MKKCLSNPKEITKKLEKELEREIDKERGKLEKIREKEY